MPKKPFCRRSYAIPNLRLGITNLFRCRIAAKCPYPPEFAWDPTRSWTRSARAGWAKCTARRIHGSIAPWPSRFCLLKSSAAAHAESWSHDGRFLLYAVYDAKTNWDIWVLPLEGDKKPVPFLVTEFKEHDARFSPDGHWVAYASNESGQYEVYVRSFAMNSAGTAVEVGGKWQISNGSGFEPRWRGDGQELYYHAQNGQVMAVEIATNPEFKPGKPQPLGFVSGVDTGTLWDSTADGRRFLVAVPKRAAKNSGPEPYTVILNWQAGLKK